MIKIDPYLKSYIKNVCAHAPVLCLCAPRCVWRSEVGFQEAVFFFHLIEAGPVLFSIPLPIELSVIPALVFKLQVDYVHYFSGQT